jgi:plasmid stabilization system protein ParE
VFYRIQGDTTVVIVRILHDRMDIPARLSDEGGG